MKMMLRLCAAAVTLFFAGCGTMKFGWEPSGGESGRRVVGQQAAAPQAAAAQAAADNGGRTQDSGRRTQADGNNARQAAAAQAAAAIEWRQVGGHDYEADAPGKGLGFSRAMKSETGTATLYVYDLKKTWADGTRDADFDAHFRGCLSEVGQMAVKGIYRDLRIGAPSDVSIDGRRTRVIRMTFATDEGKLESFLYLTATGGKLVKLRATFSAPAPEGVRESLAELTRRIFPLVNQNP
jgi:hypothetical protein